ncbi:MarR family winged helix-turn-helix transcriptional regulator [Microvirga guangxiensis]|uniref:DNA-binding transcriptional regulator, MarR family n=1 Tax=Microvirga guangxiensis TaxID=549386 RepID=A0A1G5BHD9_9HYPH|nr:MarR family transcriptional regulator [Microvirga guangxiensis]SCX89585.1 DNA-binding transcriptional regulator, MarR family [Microvirga guangxiensis]
MAHQIAAQKRESSSPTVILESFLPYRLNVLASLTSNALAQIYAERFGLSIPAWRVIATLGQYEYRTARDIASHGVMHKSTVSRAVASLEQRGLIVRKPNQDDRREEWLELTEEGREIYEALAPEALAFEDRFVSVLTEEEQKVLAALIDRLSGHARLLGPEGEVEG